MSIVSDTDSRAADGKIIPWLKVPLDVRSKLDLLEVDAVFVWWSLLLWCAANDTRTIAKRDVPGALGRRLSPKRLAAALDDLTGHAGLLTDQGDTLEQVEWHQIPAKVWSDDVARARYLRDRRLHSAPDLKNQIRKRDRGLCRYCGIRPQWGANNSKIGATFDHVDPDVMENTYDGIVVACNACNGRKKDRTPEQADMPLLRPGVSAADRESMLQRGVSPFVREAAWALPRLRAFLPRSGAPPGRTAVRPGSDPELGIHARAREPAPDRTAVRPDPARPGGPHLPRPDDDRDRLDSLAADPPPNHQEP